MTPSSLKKSGPRVVRFAAALIAAAAGPLFAQSAWLPETGELIASPGFTFQTIDRYFEGTTRGRLPADLTQQTGYLSLDFGVGASFAVDAAIGFSRTRFAPPGAPVFRADGTTDFQLGLRYRLLEEKSDGPSTPTVALRVGGIVAGSYPVSFGPPPISPGDGANGAELSLLTGKIFGESGFGYYGDIGFRARDHGVPDDVFGRVGGFRRAGPVAVSLGYRHVQGLSGGDIGGRGFGSAYGFSQVREIDRSLDAGVTYTDRGGRSYQLQVARTVGGRNTGEKWIFSLAASVPVDWARLATTNPSRRSARLR